MKNFSSNKGFTLIESIVATAFLMGILGGVMIKVNTIKEHIVRTEKVLSLDSLESWLRPILVDQEAIAFSASKLKDKRLSNCLEGRFSCLDKQEYSLSIYLRGQKEPITGRKAKYDRDGVTCDERRCGYYRIRTSVTTHCAIGSNCSNPEFLTVKYEIQDLKENGKTLRLGFLESNRFRNKRFPQLSVTCPGDQVLRGVGISGEPLCVRQGDVKLTDASGDIDTGVIDVKRRDCRQINQDQRDQYYIQGMTRSGDLLCAERFW